MPQQKSMMDHLTLEKHGVPQEFDRIARGYDLLSSMNPGYFKHLCWSARRMKMESSARILDLCCGTGLSTAALRQAYPQARLTGLDASKGMLQIAAAKPPLSDIRWIEGNAMDPATEGATGPFDGILMAYGIRNVSDPDLCLGRLRGLLRPGGVLCLHEYSVADSQWSKAVWQLITLGVVIPLGLVATGSTSIFRYLRRSVMAFDGKCRLEQRMRDAGFEDVHTLPMDGWQRGVVHSFLARVPGS